ncbi:transmembrane protein 53 isoform X2 [Episyrphus balteatus]|uniref:transmembrane protein 53 isoform X2 n=1 Tax=Episyrphus balteatus TaxID=286459 RepID=UPI002485DEA0|nr:transmembrane protein 53 isoform X2 [Episyrphus balteatus]
MTSHGNSSSYMDHGNPYGSSSTNPRRTTQSSTGYYQKGGTSSSGSPSRSGSGTGSGNGGSNNGGGNSGAMVHRQSSQQQQQHDQSSSSNLHPEDSLEYFIKFPTPHFKKEIESAESDFVFVYKETNVPIVMLLGWAGCQDRYLMKYSKIYEDRGLITVRYTAPVETLFWKRTAMKPIGEKILKLIHDMNFDSHPLIFHIFSNGGAYLYQHISLAIRNNKNPIQIRGMIFDSAPGERRMLGLFRAVTAIYGREKRKCNCLAAVFITLTLSFMWFVEETYTAFKSLFVKTEPSQTNPFNDLKNEPNQFPQLFMYSKGDVVIPYEDIENFAKYREQRGVDVSKICFEDAEHVKIYTKYPQQYIHCVCSFINNCLAVKMNLKEENREENHKKTQEKL